MTMRKTLILCSSLPEARAYQTEARSRGERIIASSSVKYDETAGLFDEWEWLPDIYSADFTASLLRLLSAHEVAQIYCPHFLVWQHVHTLLAEGVVSVPLIGNMPLQDRIDEIKNLVTEAERARQWISLVSGREPLPAIQIAAILRQAHFTYGQSSPTKIMAMMAAFLDLPEGDVVEIGSYCGKTASALAMLSRFHLAGAVLCVDPWQMEAASQKDSPDIVRDAPQLMDWGAFFTGFCINTMAVATPGAFNYLRMASEAAAHAYKKNTVIVSPEFGETKYAGKVAFIHIDGNHDYSNVRIDYEAWRPHMAPGGWMVFDDYVWHHGEGPQRAGDEALEKEKRVRRSFVAGKALFIQFERG